MHTYNLLSNNYNQNNLSNLPSLQRPGQQSPTTATVNRIWSNLDIGNAEFNNICQSLVDCPMSYEEIVDHSMLDSFEIDDFPPELQELMREDSMEGAVRRIAANFAAGGLATGGKGPFSLDGMPSGEPNFVVWEWLLSNLRESMIGIEEEERAIIDKLYEGISQMREYCEDMALVENAANGEEMLFEISLKYAEKVQQLQPGESQSFFGGWSNVGSGTGHALVYEYIRNEDLTFDVIVYTSTNFQLADNIFAGDKLRVKPYIQFSQIPERHLCFNGDGVTRPVFFQHFIELKALRHWDNNFVVEEEDILEALDHLLPYQRTVDWEESGAITGQRGGTCVPSSTKVWMRRHASNAATHTQIMLHCKFRLIVATYRALKEELKEDTQEGALSRRVLIHMTKNHLRLIAKAMNTNLFNPALLSDQLAQNAQATCYHILKNLESLESDIHQLRKSVTLENRVASLSVDKQREKRRSARDSMRCALIRSPPDKVNNQGILPPRITIDSPREIPEAIEDICQFAFDQTDKKNIDTLVNMRINQLVDQLPLPELVQHPNGVSWASSRSNWIQKVGHNFWDDLGKEELSELLSRFEELLLLYSEHCGAEQKTRVFATLTALQALTHYLAIRIDTLKAEDELPEMPRLEHYLIPHIGSFLEEIEGIIFIDNDEFKRIQEALNYFKAFNRHVISTSNKRDPLFKNEKDTKVDKTQIAESPGNKKYWEALFNACPKLADLLDEEAENKISNGMEWKDLDRDEIEMIYNRQMETYHEKLAKYDRNQEWARNNPGDPNIQNILAQTPPLHPKKRQNMPQLVKRLLLLEESIGMTPDNPLVACDLSHIVRIRRMTLLFHRAYLQPLADKNFHFKARRNSLYDTNGRVEKFKKWEDFDPRSHSESVINSQQGASRTELQSKFFRHFAAKRGKTNWKRHVAEGTTLEEIPEELQTPLLKELLRSGSEWRLTPYQIINAVKEQKEELANRDLQKIIFRHLLRSPVSFNKSMHIGFGEILIEDPSLSEYCSEFISEGLNYFYSRKKEFSGADNAERSGQDIPVNGARFFLELAYYTSKYLIDQGVEGKAWNLLTDCLNFTDRWLNLEDLSQKEKAVIHQYRLLFFSLIPVVENDGDALSERYLSWISCQFNPVLSPLLQSQVEKYITVLTSEIAEALQNNEELRSDIGSSLVQKLELPADNRMNSWTYSLANAPNVLEGGGWKIDLISGSVFGPKGKVGLRTTTQFPWESQDNFKRLFGESSDFSYLSIGPFCFTFTHPEMGLIRIIESQNNPPYTIQRQFPGFEGIWFEEKQIPVSNGSYPKILSSDHVYWIPERRISNTGITALFTSLRTNQVKFASIENGSIVELKIDDEGRFQEGLYVDFYETSSRNKQALAAFERPGNILTYKRDSEQGSELIKTTFPRYASQEGNPLSFRFSEGRLVWEENTQYYIPDSSPQGFLGTIPNYLFLQSDNESNPDILLVPFQEISTKQHAAPKLDIDSGLKTAINADEREQWGCCQYFVFQIVNGSVKPATLEGQIFLSYLSLSQKNYREAAKCLKEIKPNQKLSPNCEKILELIISFPFEEDDPNARMAALHAEYLSLRNKKQQAHEDINFFEGEDNVARLWNSMECAEKCLQSLNNINVECRLTAAQELELLTAWVDHMNAPLKNSVEEMAELLGIPIDRIKLVLKQLERRALLLKSQTHEPLEFDTFNLQGSRVLPESEGGRNRMKMNSRFFFPTNKNDIRLTEWLSSGTSSTLCSRPSKSLTVVKNGVLLLEMHTIAKNGSIDERKAALYRLWQWRIHSSMATGEMQFLDLMIDMLIFPDAYEEPLKLKDNTSVKKKLDYLKKLEQSYNRRSQDPSIANLDVSRFLHGSHQPSSKRPYEEGNYPIPDRSSLDFLHLTSVDSRRAKTPLDVAFPENDDRWRLLRNWKEKFIIEEEQSDENNYRELSLDYDPSLLNIGEEEYGDPFRSDLFSLKRDYLLGKKQNEEKTVWTISSDDALKLMIESRTMKEGLDEAINQKTQKLLELVNTPADNPQTRLMEFARVGGGAVKRLTFSDCVEKVLEMDIQGFQELNQHLSPRQIQRAASLTIEIEDLKSYRSQLERISSTAKKVAAIDDLNDQTRGYQCQLLAQELDAEYDFQHFEEDPDIHVALRVFSGETGIIPHRKQARLIKQMLKIEKENPEKYRDIIIQLIMGGGKTSVIATIILYLAAKRSGRLALFIVPPSLFATVETNISESIWGAFKKLVLPIDLNREELTIYKLDQLIDKLNEAEEKHQPIIMKATTLQTIELELISQGRQFRKTAEKYKELLEMHHSTVEKEGRITEWLRQHGNRQGNTAEKRRQEITLNRLKSLSLQLDNSMRGHDHFLRESKLKIIQLAKIWKKFADQGDALIDEVDLVLDCLKEVNFPEGEPVPIDPDTNSLILACFKALTSNELYVDIENQTSVGEVVGLRKNNQTLLDTQTYLNQIVPIVAENLIEAFDPIKNAVPREFKESFIRYVSNFIPCEFQQLAGSFQQLDEQYLNDTITNWNQLGYTLEEAENDTAFLNWLEGLYSEGGAEGKQNANLIAAARHLLTEVLPATLSKSGRRDYGPSPQSSSFSVVPYVGVNSPATTFFGYFLEEACYYYQWAAAFPLEKQDVLKFAQSVETAARHYVEKNQEKFEETVEYQEFYQLFGITLDQVNQPEMLELAVQNISLDTEKKLDFQFELIAQKVKFQPERLSSNGRNLMRQVSSRRAMSGTPWNAEGFDRKLYQRFKRDEGSEGKILHTMAKKAEQGQIYEVDFETVEEFFDQIFDIHPHPDKVRGIIETGGLFKVFDNNAVVAKKLMECLLARQLDGQISSDIEGVLFFHKDPGQQQSDTLYVWKKGAACPERIGGSSKEALLAKGLDPARYFVYYDERHTTGVDILQIPDAVNLLTFDEKMLRRTIGQGAMRLRQYLFSQNVEIVVTDKTRKLLVNQGENLEDFILSAEKKQSIQKTNHMVRYFRQQVDGAPRDLAVERIVNAALALETADDDSENAFIQEIAGNESFFVTKTDNEFYLNHGKLRQTVETKSMLLEELEERVNQFTHRIDDPEMYQKIIREKEELASHIQNSACLPPQWIQIPPAIGIQQEVEMQVQLETNNQVLIQNELEEELQLELEEYHRLPGQNLLEEKRMSREQFLDLIDLVSSQEEVPGCVITLQSQLASFEYGPHENRNHYENAFHEPIYGTHAFFNTFKNRTLPFFHRLQRPPRQILAIRTPEGSFRWLLLTEHEASAARKHLKRMHAKNEGGIIENVWLIQPDGSVFISGNGQELFPIEDKSVERGMLELNALAGNAYYLNQHGPEFEEWLGDETELKIRFLKLRTSDDTRQNALLQINSVIHQFDQNHAATNSQHVLKKRLEQEKNYQGRLRLDNPADVKLLAPIRVKNLHVDQVRYLGIDWNAQDSDPYTIQAVEKLKNEAGEPNFLFRQAVLKVSRDGQIPLNYQRLARRICNKQFENLQPYHVPYLTKEQMKWVPKKLIPYLERPEQICDFSREERVYYPPDIYQWTQYLDESQKHLIPFINPAEYANFNKGWQIAAIDPKDVEMVPKRRWEWLSKRQVKHLPRETTEEDLNNLKIPEKFGWIHGDLLERIPKKFLHKVCREQIREITDPDLICKLEQIAKTFEGRPAIQEGLWTSWITPEMVEHINFDEQIQFLATPEQIKRVPDEEVEKLNPETQVPLIRESSQVKCLRGSEQIQACPEHLISELKGKQLNFISFKQVPLLKKNRQIQAITDPDRFACLTSEESLENNTINQIMHITDQQLELISDWQIKGLSNQNILAFANLFPERRAELQDNLSVEQIQTFNSQELINLLSQEQISNYLQKRQVGFLQDVLQIQACPEHLTSELKGEQLNSISSEQVPFLGDSQIQTIHDPDLFAKLTETQMKWIGEDQIKMVSANQVMGLRSGQLLLLRECVEGEDWPEYQKNLSYEQIQTFDSQELIDLLSQKNISDHLHDEQVQFLQKEWQINACPDELVSKLSEDQVRLLNEEKIAWLNTHQVHYISLEQIPLLKDETQIQSCPCEKNWVEKFTKEQFKFLTDGQIALLTDEQIGQMDDIENEISRLKPSQLHKVNPEIIQNFNEDLVRRMQDNEEAFSLIGRVKSDHIPVIRNIRAFEYLTSEQINKLTIDQVNLLEPNNPLWGKISGDLIKQLAAEKIQYLPSGQLKHLEGKEQIRKISFWKVKHLNKEQLKSRSLGQFLTYTIGVVVFGVVSSVIALIAYTSLIPFAILLLNRKKGSRIIRKLNTNPKRLYRYFEVYLSKEAAESPTKRGETD